MKNKALEILLLNKSLNNTIDLIEKCESGYYTEIRITKEEGITHDKQLDRRVIGYLKKINVRVIYITEADYYQAHNRFYKAEEQCSDSIHQIVITDKINIKEKVEMLEELSIKGEKINRFKIDDSSYVTCSKCNHILKL